MTRQTDCQSARKSAVINMIAHLGAGRLRQTPTLRRTLAGLDTEPALALHRKPGAWPAVVVGGMTGAQPWTGEWSVDELSESYPGEGGCAEHAGTLCPKLAEARARQALAEHQLVEFNHRLVNVLQMLATRIERERRMQDDPARRHELERLVASVQASAQLHRYLLPPRQPVQVDLALLLGNVATAIEGVTGLLCDVDAEPLNVSGQVAMHLASAVNELAWNAHKHAYGGAEGGVIRIVCRRDADARLRLSVADLGCGLPADFDPLASKGLGLTVVRETARRFGGELRVESDRGACFTLLLDIPQVLGPCDEDRAGRSIGGKRTA